MMMQSQDMRITAEDRAKHDAQFYQLKPIAGYITGEQARAFFLQSGLPKVVLGHIWGLADINGDGKMDKQEFSIAMFLIKRKLQGSELPPALPPSLKQQQQPAPAMGGGFSSSFTMGSSGQLPSSGGFQSLSRSATLPHTGTQPAVPSPERSASVSSGPEWSIPHGTKLRYKQIFNTNDNTRSGFLTGPQARMILVQTGLPQGTLAQIWGLADIDNDGRLTQDEFCVAMHLADMAKVGQTLPATLPPHLVPPSFRRGRSGSNLSLGGSPSVTQQPPPTANAQLGGLLPPAGLGVNNMPPLQTISPMMAMTPQLLQQQSLDEVLEEKPMEPVSFEDRKRKNFEKGQMELERRRAMLREEQLREKDRQLHIEKQEHEKRERIRMEQERRRQMELDKLLARQREFEAEQEEQRRKMIEQREAARRELEKQRQLEIQRQRRQELEAQRIKHQEEVCHLKSKSKTLTCELETLEDKKNSLNKQLSDSKKYATEHHTTIILMGQTRDAKVAEIERLQKEIHDQRQVKLSLDAMKDDVSDSAKKLGINHDVTENYRTVMHSFGNKRKTVQRLRDSLREHETRMESTLLEVDGKNTQITELKARIPKEEAEIERLTQQQQQTIVNNRKRQQLSTEQQKATTAEQHRIRDENLRRQAEEEKKRHEEQVAQQWKMEEVQRAATKKQEDKTKEQAPFDAFSNFGSGQNDPFSSGFGDISAKPVDPSDPFNVFSDSTEATKISSQKDDPFGAFADFSNATFDFASPQSSTSPSPKPAQIIPAPKPPKPTPVARPPKPTPVPKPPKPTPAPKTKTYIIDDVSTTTEGTMLNEKSSYEIAIQPSTNDSGVVPSADMSRVLFKRYKALYEFTADTAEELSINPGDIILVGKSENAEPGWLGGEINGRIGWFPENYAEAMPTDDDETSTGGAAGWASFETTAPVKTAEVIKPEAPSETASPSAFTQPTKSSLYAEIATSAVAQPTPSPTPGQGKILGEGVQAEALYNWEAKKSNHLSFRAGDVITLKEQQDMWWLGQLAGKEGWFPKTQVKELPKGEPTSSDVELPALTTLPSTSPGVSAITSALFAEAAAPSPSITMPTLAAPNTSAKQASSSTPEAEQSYTATEYVSLYTYKSEEPNDLNFAAGETILVTKKDDDWWTGTAGDRHGIFPANYVQAKTVPPTAATLVNSVEPEPAPVPTAVAESSNEFVAKFAFASDQPGDLTFEAGETVIVTKNEGDWWTGRIGEREGIFPPNYVVPKEGDDVPTILETPSGISAVQDEAAAKTASLSRKPEIARVIAPYTATSAEQLSLSLGQLIAVRKKNPSGWWEGELQARGKKKQIGWFPANYVQLMSVGSPGTGTPTEQGPLIAAPVQGGERAVTPSIDTICQVITIYPYIKQSEDELSFQKGVCINVISKDDKDWWRGEFNGQSGVFPSNYAQELTDTGRSNNINWTKDLYLLENTTLKERHRQESIHEIINTEQAYVDDLALAIEVFQKPLGESGKLDVQEISRIFVNWREIMQCNNKLLKSLRVRKKMSGEGQLIHMIGDILCEQLPRMTAYIRFCSCQLNASSLLQQRIDSDPEFKDYIKKLAQDPRVKGMPISSYLIKPMQRITRYPLLIKKILKYTEETHPDHTTARTALEKAEELCQQVNEGVREKENSDNLEWLQAHVDCTGLAEELIFNSLTNCLGPRKYLHSGKLHKSKKNKELYAFLFNDFLLFTQPVKPGLLPFVASNNKSTVEYRMYRQPLFLNEVDVKAATDVGAAGGGGGGGGDALFNINHIDKVYSMRAESMNDKNRWMEKVQTASKNYIETEKKKREKLQRARSMRSKGVGRLLVVIIEGHDLKPSNNVTGRADPYCEVRMGSQEQRTRVVPDTLRPVWDASMQFTVKDLEQDVLCITVYDRDLFSPNDFLGRTEVRVADVIKETQGHGPLTKQLLLHEVSTGEVLVKLTLHLYDQS